MSGTQIDKPNKAMDILEGWLILYDTLYLFISFILYIHYELLFFFIFFIFFYLFFSNNRTVINI